MSTTLYTSSPNASGAHCPYRNGTTIPWSDELPQELQALVVAPVSFKVFQDYEMQADQTHGCDASNQPCYCEFRYVLTQPRSDDDELFYEVPVYAELLTSWRLIDERWLVRRSIIGNFDQAACQTSFSLSEAMPR